MFELNHRWLNHSFTSSLPNQKLYQVTIHVLQINVDIYDKYYCRKEFNVIYF